MAMLEDGQAYYHQGPESTWTKHKMGVTRIFYFICIITFCLILICIQNIGDILKYDYTNYATDDTAISNKAANGLSMSFPDTVDACLSSYAPSGGTMCLRSRAGLFLNSANSGHIYPMAILNHINDIYLEDHETNSLAARIFVNPLVIQGTPHSNEHILTLALSLYYSFGIVLSFTLGIPGTQGVRFSFFDGIGTTLFYYEFTAPLITAPSWVDVVFIHTYIRNNPGTIISEQKVYSSGLNSILPELQIETNLDQPIADVVSDAALYLYNRHHLDFTIQYLNIYGGTQTLASISTALCLAPILVPPEYCSDASTDLLANGCADTADSACKTSCIGFPCTPSSVPVSSSNYTSPLTNGQVVWVAMAVCVGVDLALVGIVFLLTICSLNLHLLDD